MQITGKRALIMLAVIVLLAVGWVFGSRYASTPHTKVLAAGDLSGINLYVTPGDMETWNVERGAVLYQSYELFNTGEKEQSYRVSVQGQTIKYDGETYTEPINIVIGSFEKQTIDVEAKVYKDTEVRLWVGVLKNGEYDTQRAARWNIKIRED